MIKLISKYISSKKNKFKPTKATVSRVVLSPSTPEKWPL